MRGVYKFYWDCGSMGFIDGIFVADSDDVAKVMGEEVYFGEVLGKHSEILGVIAKEDLRLITADIGVVELVESFNLVSGYNPLDYFNPR